MWDQRKIDDVRSILVGVIETSISAHPRSQQKRIGPSEIGNPCDRCLAHKLAGTQPTEQKPSWKPALGTAIHAQLEHWFSNTDGELAGHFECERKVMVGQIAGEDITGSCDLWMPAVGLVNDWKLVGPKQLTRYKNHNPPEQYRVQAHLYARGFALTGEHPQQVAITFLPRDGELSLAHFWTEAYSEQVALDALERATRLANNIEALRTVSENATLTWMNALPRAEGCYSCRRYPELPAEPGATSTKTLLGL